MIIKEALSKAQKFLNQKNGRLEAEIILAHLLRQSREYILINSGKKLSPHQEAGYFLSVRKRAKGYPVAYLTGEKEFYGLKFLVNENVLIPRPETELMVEEAMKRITWNVEHITIADVGTGSGCIIVTLAKLLNQGLDNQETTANQFDFFGIDISPEALKIARKNAKINGVDKKIKFLQGNLLEPLYRSRYALSVTRYVILANLPYLTPAQIKASPSIKHEPRLALTAGADGLRCYRQLFRQVRSLGLKKYELLCEIDHTQTSDMKKLIKQELPSNGIEIIKDLGGYDRLVIIKNSE